MTPLGGSIQYLALGDSYTIGTGLEQESENFPSVLARRLTKERGIPVDVRNLGVNGYTTADLIREELPVARAATPELVTVLIGANDVVQGVDHATYGQRLAEIYDTIARLAAKSVVAISIPDFSALPGAAPFGTPEGLRQRINGFNDLAREVAAGRDFEFVDVTAISRASGQGGDWFAADELHPGPAQHRAFANKVWDAVGAQWRMVRGGR